MGGITPIYGIHYPNGTTRAKDLGLELGILAQDIEQALAATGLPPWTPGQVIAAKTDGAVTAAFGSPGTEAARLALQNQGPLVVRTDKGNRVETYLATYNAQSNPSGRAVPGWYPIAAPLRHAEFTTLRTGMPDGGPSGLGSLSVDAGQTIGNDFATVVANGVTLLPGMYTVTGTFSIGGLTPATSRTFIDAQISGEAEPRSRQAIPLQEDRATVVLPNLYLASSKTLVFNMYKGNGRTSDVTGRIALTRSY